MLKSSPSSAGSSKKFAIMSCHGRSRIQARSRKVTSGCAAWNATSLRIASSSREPPDESNSSVPASGSNASKIGRLSSRIPLHHRMVGTPVPARPAT